MDIKQTIIDIINKHSLVKISHAELVLILLESYRIPVTISESTIQACINEGLIDVTIYQRYSLSLAGHKWLSKAFRDDLVHSEWKAANSKNLMPNKFIMKKVWAFLNQNLPATIIGGIIATLVVLILIRCNNNYHLWERFIHLFTK